ncbi:MAG TPA: hypothetical protein VFG38_17920 [Pseudomonadales bacterium]|nr:hypothetical protein [Pseudomonadales bacterium]
MKATAKCLCGRVTFTAHDVEPGMHVCHCAMCRRRAGSPAATHARPKPNF